MTALINTTTDERRRAHAHKVEEFQAILGQIQGQYRDNTLAFKALGLAYEAMRLAWYAVQYEDDGGHINDVGDMLAFVRMHLKQAYQAYMSKTNDLSK